MGNSFMYEVLPVRKYGHPCDFAEEPRRFILQDNVRGEQSVVTVPKGVPTIDELISFRRYKQENGHKPNDWDALEPKNGVFINGKIIPNVDLIDQLIDEPLFLQIIRNFDPKNPIHDNDWVGYFKGLTEFRVENNK